MVKSIARFPRFDKGSLRILLLGHYRESSFKQGGPKNKLTMRFLRTAKMKQ
jgi:hypothetical protein